MLEGAVHCAKQGQHVLVLSAGASHVHVVKGLLATISDDPAVLARVTVKPYQNVESGDLRGRYFEQVYEDHHAQEARASAWQREWEVRLSSLIGVRTGARLNEGNEP